jgi:cold shock CspA family protein
MGRSQETFHKKEVRKKKEKKRLEKEKKRQARKEKGKNSGLDEMIAYVDETGMITSTPPDPDKKTNVEAETIEVGVPKKDPSGNDNLRTGKVTSFDESKGYGFIRDSETGESIFVHANDLLEKISADNTVSFERVKGEKGPAALNVRRLEE